MRELTLKLMLAVAVIGLGCTVTRADVLRSVEVGAPAINCLFDPTCRIEVTDSTETLSIGAGGANFLQSRTFRAKAGSPAAGLYVYEYRIDLRRAEGILHIPCIDSLSLDFDHIVRTLDLDGDGERGDEVFVVTRGGLGSIGLASAEKSGSTITFRFSDSVCAGGHPNAGESTFFFGLVSTHAPVRSTAWILETTGRKSKVYAHTPRPKDHLQNEIPGGAPVKNRFLSRSSERKRMLMAQFPIRGENPETAEQGYDRVINHFRPNHALSVAPKWSSTDLVLGRGRQGRSSYLVMTASAQCRESPGGEKDEALH